MKNFVRYFGIIITVVIIIFGVASCGTTRKDVPEGPVKPEGIPDHLTDRGMSDHDFFFGGEMFRNAMTKYKYLIVEIPIDDLQEVEFVLQSGNKAESIYAAYEEDGGKQQWGTRVPVQGKRVRGTNWWYIENEYPISFHLGNMEDIGWWFQLVIKAEGFNKANFDNDRCPNVATCFRLEEGRWDLTYNRCNGHYVPWTMFDNVLPPEK